MDSTCYSITSRRAVELETIAQNIRSDIVATLGVLGEEHRGHPGPSLSIVDLVTALYYEILRVDPAHPEWPERDRFVLSKGHGCLAVYVALARRGFFSPQHLPTFRSIDSMLQGHPDMSRTPGIDMTSGSLGNGLSAGVGMALGRRSFRNQSHVYVLMGDGELQEGIVWEAAMTASKYGLHNLTVIVDCNGFQGGGCVADIMPVEPLRAKWESFGWDVFEIDGHKIQQIVTTLTGCKMPGKRPTVILAHTVKGKGVSYMEGDNHWHQKALPGPAIENVNKVPNRYRETLRSMTAAYGHALLELARERPEIAIIAADAVVSMGLESVKAELPERCVDVGIAEQNLMMVAGGLATTGMTVFASTYSAFVMRACEQIRTFIAYPKLNVKIVAGLAGLSGGIEGVTHLATEDLGMMRAIPNLVILNPADATATTKAVRAAAEHLGPVYVRLGRDPSPTIFGDDYRLTIGKALVLNDEGCDVALLTSGLITSEVIRAAHLLRHIGIRCKVIEFATIKPFDAAIVSAIAPQVQALCTIEEHNIIGGIGSAVLEALAHEPCIAIHRIGIPDCFVESGTPEELRRKYGLTAQQIARRVRGFLQRGIVFTPPQQERRDDRVREHHA